MMKTLLGCLFLIAHLVILDFAEAQNETDAVASSTNTTKTHAEKAKPEKVTFKASDGWIIGAAYVLPRQGKPVWILVHGVGSGKGEWGKFAAKLSAMGHGALAIDLRGHGESLQGPGNRTATYEIFDVTGDWPHCLRDLEGALAFLKGRGIGAGRVGLIGASIGANLVSQLAAANDKITRVALLSPGINYRGVECAKDIPGRKALLAASIGDGYAYQSVVVLTRSMKESLVFQSLKGHGVQMFDDPDFLKKFLAWIAKD